jgi:hypothetical protein
LLAYLKEHCKTHALIKERSFVKAHRASLEMIARGAKMWKDTWLAAFREAFISDQLPIPSTNQMTELMFKILTDISSVHGRSESVKSLLLTCISAIQPRAKRRAHRLSLAKPRKQKTKNDETMDNDDETKDCQKVCNKRLVGRRSDGE